MLVRVVSCPDVIHMCASKEAALSPVENNNYQIRIREKQDAFLEFSLLKNITMFSTLYELPYNLFLDETFFPNDLLNGHLQLGQS